VPAADVAVVGAGLAGLATALRLADRGARVVVLAQGNGALHWAGGPIDVAVAPGAATPAAALQRLAADPDHPYASLARDVAPALDWFGALTADAGLPHVGSLDEPFGPLPTGIGGTRPVAIVPESQAAALRPWGAGERLVVVGPTGFKDFWPRAVAASLSRQTVWRGLGRPDRVDGIAVDLPGLAARRNLNPLRIAEQFDDPAWRAAALDVIARAVDGTGRGPLRIGLPAVLGCRAHPAVLRDALERLGHPIVELPLVPPGIPGIRLYDALRAALLARGGRLLLGEPVARVETRGRRVVSVATTAATREVVTRVGALVLATGGVAGGGLVGDPDGRIVETVLGLPVDGPPIERWMTGDALDPGGMPIAAAGIRTDADLRPVDPARRGEPALFENVHVVGALLAGQRYLLERCGDGVALASAWRAAAALATEPPAVDGLPDRSPADASPATGGGIR
jgi:glycerol-3-phosphate dehydrogenase subunit B